jgi:O-antigen/teichoic acid export membrane protein
VATDHVPSRHGPEAGQVFRWKPPVASSLRGLTELAVVGVLWTALATGAQAILQLVALVVLARLLSPHEFGVFAAVLVVIGFSTIFSQLGVGPAIVQRPVLEERHLRTGYTLSLLFGVSLLGLVGAAAPTIARFFGASDLVQVLRTASVVFALQGSCAVAEALALRKLRFRWLAGVDACAFAGGFIGVAPVLAWLGFGVWALVGAYLVQQLLRMALLLAGQNHPKRPQLELRAMRELLHFGGGFTLARIGNYVAGQGDNLVVGGFLGPQALGLYGHAHQLMTAPAVFVGQVLDRVLFPAMALVQLEPSRLARAYRSGSAICALAVLPASVIVATVAPELVLVLLGPAWIGVVVPFKILALAMLFRASYKLSDSVARATGAVYARALRQSIFAFAVLFGASVGQFWGLGGVALGVFAAIALNFVMMTQLSLRLTGMRWSEIAAAHLPALALTLMVGGPTWALVEWLRELHIAPAILLLGVTFAAGAMSLILCWSLPPVFLGQDVRSLLRTIMTVAPKPLQRRWAG